MERLVAIACAALFAVSIAATVTAQEVPVDPMAAGDCPGPTEPTQVDLPGAGTYYVCTVDTTQQANSDLDAPVLWMESNNCDGLQRSSGIQGCPNDPVESDTNCSDETLACSPLQVAVNPPRAGPALP